MKSIARKVLKGVRNRYHKTFSYDRPNVADPVSLVGFLKKREFQILCAVDCWPLGPKEIEFLKRKHKP